MSSPSAELSSFYYTLKGALILNRNKINKSITRKCLKLFHHTHCLFNIWHISSCELFWEYEVKCTHYSVWEKFLHFTLKNKCRKMCNGIFPRWPIVRAFFLANRNHFLRLLRFSWSAYTSFCSLEQITCHMFGKFCCHTSFKLLIPLFKVGGLGNSDIFTDSYSGSSGSLLALTTSISFSISTGI